MKHHRKLNWVYDVALLLDPRIRSAGLLSTPWGKNLEKEAIEKLKSMYEEYYTKLADHIEVKQPQKKKGYQVDKESSKKSSLDFNVCYPKYDKSEDYLVMDKSEIDEYLYSPQSDAKINLLQWWKNHQNVYPVLAAIARDVLCVPATSVPVERMFSEAAHVVTKTRCSLQDEKIRELVCINLWMKSDLRKEICEVDL